MKDHHAYRVWDGERYRGNTYLDNYGELMEIVNTPMSLNSETLSISDEDYVIEFCTGIKGINGDLIYEGDIILATDFRPEINKVIFHQGGYHCEDPSDKRISTAIDFFFPSVGPQLEVIGNIHENPELLLKRDEE